MSPRRVVAAVLVAGALLQALLWSRQWIYGDQYALLLPALAFLDTGQLQPFAKAMSGAGRIPGTLLQWLVGLPLFVWPSYLAPTLLVALFHAIAAALLSFTLGRALGARFLAAYLCVYWLSPWRLYHAGFLWEPAYLFLPAALHLSSAHALRTRPHPAWSAAIAATLTLTLQLHASSLVLWILTALLVIRGRIRLHWAGAAAGFLAGAFTLLPTIRAFAGGTLPRLAPQETEEIARWIVGLLNGAKALGYWVRLGSSDIGRRLRQTVSGDGAGFDGHPWAAALVSVLVAATFVSLLVALAASWRYFRGAQAKDAAVPAEPLDDWFRAYAGWCLVALSAAALVSPVPLQAWHVVIAFHAACLPVADWLVRAMWGASAWRKTAALAFIAIEVAVVLTLAFGHPMYRPRAGDDALRQDIPDRIRPILPPAR